MSMTPQELMFPEVEGLPGSHSWWDARWLAFRIVASGTMAKSQTYGKDVLLADWISADIRKMGVRKKLPSDGKGLHRTRIGQLMKTLGIEPSAQNYYSLRAACKRVEGSSQ